MSVGVEVLQVVDRAEAEAEDDLAEAIALLLRLFLDVVEAVTVDPLGHEPPPAREARDDIRHVDERMAAIRAREGPLALCLELVVELLEHALLQLLGRRARI